MSEAVRIGWRNLWRNRRRTWLTSGGIAFAVLLVVAFMCLQEGSYAGMVSNATSLMTGHIQLQNPEYVASERLERTLAGVTPLLRRIADVAGVAAVSARVEVFALASAGERSFGARILGVDPAAEADLVRLPRQLIAGRGLERQEDALLGEALARNLGVRVGDEVVILGSGREGGVAALVVNVAGVFSTGMAELDRALLWTSIESVQDAFGLGDEAHTVVVRTRDVANARAIAAAIAERIAAEPGGSGVRPLVRTWDDVLPDVHQAIEIDRLTGELMYWIIMLLVAFSVVNTFVMTVFERTREFGMLRAIGMGPGRIMLMLQWEALFLWALGSLIGMGIALVLVGWLQRTGIPLAAELEELTARMYITDRIYPELTPRALLLAPLVMLIGTQIAAALPSLRVWRLKPVDALRVAA